MLHRLIFVLTCLVGTLMPLAVAAKTDTVTCGATTSAFPAACRQFIRTDSLNAGEPTFFQFLTLAVPPYAGADAYYSGLLEGLIKSESMNLTVVESNLDFGSHATTLSGSFISETVRVTVGMVLFAVDNGPLGTVLVNWGVAGVDIDPFPILHDLWVSKSASYSAREDISKNVAAFLPTADDLPSGFTMTLEQYSVQFDASAIDSGQKRGKPTVPESTGSQLELVDITTKDAGIGNGTFYAYVEIRNRSSKSYPYLGIDATCRNSSGSVVGTGFGNTTNVAPGETVVITVIFFSAPGCTRIEVRPDSLTGMF